MRRCVALMACRPVWTITSNWRTVVMDASYPRGQALGALDAALADPANATYPADTLFQGPIADALTHVGQLAMMRGMAGEPVRPESYARATIEAGRVGREQATPGREFDGDASKPKPR